MFGLIDPSLPLALLQPVTWTQHIHIFQKLVIISLSSQLENQPPLSSSAELTTHQIPVVYSSEKNHPCLDRAQTTRKYKLKRGEHTSTDGVYNLDTYVHTHTPSKRHFCPPNTAAVCVCLRAEGTPNKAGKWTQQLSKSTPGLSLNRLEVWCLAVHFVVNEQAFLLSLGINNINYLLFCPVQLVYVSLGIFVLRHS